MRALLRLEAVWLRVEPFGALERTNHISLTSPGSQHGGKGIPNDSDHKFIIFQGSSVASASVEAIERVASSSEHAGYSCRHRASYSLRQSTPGAFFPIAVSERGQNPFAQRPTCD